MVGFKQSGSEFKDGVQDGLPIFAAYLPYGIAYGLLARQAELTLFQSILMSAAVYAGTAQLIAVAMIASGQGLLSIVFTTFVVNLRYLLMNGALSQSMKGWSRWPQLIISYYVSDETFVVLTNRSNHQPLSPHYGLGVNMTALAGWLLSSCVGFTAAAHIPSLDQFGIDFALPAVLIVLATLMTKSRLSFVVATCSGILAISLNLGGYLQSSVLLAAISASILGVIILWNRTRFSY